MLKKTRTRPFIDKSKGATYSLILRDNQETGEKERIFVQTGGEKDILGVEEEQEYDDEAECDGEYYEALEKKRVELLSMGFPDDGYDYAQHMRSLVSEGDANKFKPAGGDVVYVPANYTSKKKQPVVEDVKVYDGTKAVHQAQFLGDSADAEADDYAVRAGMELSGHLKASYSLDVDVDVLKMLEMSDDEIQPADELNDDFVLSAQGTGVDESHGEVLDAQLPSSTLLTAEAVDFGRAEEASTSQFCSAEEPREMDAQQIFLAEQLQRLELEYDDDEIGDLDYADEEIEGPKDFSALEGRLGSLLERDRLKRDDEPCKHELKARTLELYADADNRPEPTIPFPEPKSEAEWDCESIVSTYTNTENHYGLITSGLDEQSNHVKLSNKTGLPIEGFPRKESHAGESRSTAASDNMPTNRHIDMRFLERRKSETPEEKKARKNAVKASKREARAAKKSTKIVYKEEFNRQSTQTSGPSIVPL